MLQHVYSRMHRLVCKVADCKLNSDIVVCRPISDVKLSTSTFFFPAPPKKGGGTLRTQQYGLVLSVEAEATWTVFVDKSSEVFATHSIRCRRKTTSLGWCYSTTGPPATSRSGSTSLSAPSYPKTLAPPSPLGWSRWRRCSRFGPQVLYRCLLRPSTFCRKRCAKRKPRIEQHPPAIKSTPGPGCRAPLSGHLLFYSGGRYLSLPPHVIGLP